MIDMLTDYTIRFAFILAALCSANSLAQPIITSGTGTITPDANGGFILDCPTGCSFSSNANTPTQSSNLTGSFNLNSNGQIALSTPIFNPSSVIYSGIPTTTGVINGETVSGTINSGGTVGGLVGTNGGSITNTGTVNTNAGSLVGYSTGNPSLSNLGNLSGAGNYSVNGSVNLTSVSTATITRAPLTLGGQTNVGGLTGTNAGSLTVSGNPNLTGGTLVINNAGTLTTTSTSIINTSVSSTLGGQTNVGGLTGTNAGSITVSGNPNLTGGTLVINNAGTLSTSSFYVGGHDGSLTLTSNGNIAILDGSSLNLAGVPNLPVQIGLNGPMLPIGNITSDAKAFSGWLNDNGLVTASQIDSIGSLVSSGQNFVLFGSHHRILLDNGIEKGGIGVWATGDYARHDSSLTNASIGELGIFKDTGNFRLGIGAGMNQAKQTLPVNGNGKLDSRYFVLEGDYRSSSLDWIVSTTLFLGSNKADISRGYLVGTTPEISAGKPKGTSRAVRIRGDWNNIFTTLGMNVSPYLSYTHAESRLDAYSETGGTLPLSFSQQTQSSNEVRAGATALSKLTEQTDLRFPLELAYRKNDSATITGSTIGLPFSFSTPSKNQSWVRMGIELDHRLSEQTVLNGAALFASQGGDSSWLATINLKHLF